MRDISIRRAIEKDIPSLCRLFFQSAKFHTEQAPYCFQVPSQEWTINFFKGHLANNNVTIFVAESDGSVIGMARAEARKSPSIELFRPHLTLHLDEIVVDENFRRQGVARKLLDQIEDLAKKSQIPQVTLNVWKFNSAAEELYKKLGYDEQRMTMKKDL